MLKTIAKDVTIAGIVGFVLTKLIRSRREHQHAQEKRFFHRLVPH